MPSQFAYLEIVAEGLRVEGYVNIAFHNARHARRLLERILKAIADVDEVRLAELRNPEG